MELIYVVELSLDWNTHKSSQELFTYTVDHVSRWLDTNNYGPTSEQLGADGSLTIEDHNSGYRSIPQRNFIWNTTGTDTARALRLDIRQRIEGGGNASLITRCTVSEIENQVSVRISLSREDLSGQLSPLQATRIYQPRIIRNLSADKNLKIYAAGQHLDDRYLQIRSLSELDPWVEAINNKHRLPLILVHPRSDEAWNLARKMATGLVGLARVATVNFHTAKAIGSIVTGASVPFGGARLLWSDSRIDGLAWTQSDIDDKSSDGVLNSAMQALSSVSAASRGADVGWRRAREAGDRLNAEQLRVKLLEAKKGGNFGIQVEALSQENYRLNAELIQWMDLAQSEEIRANTLTTGAESAGKFEQEAQYWKEQYLTLAGGTPLEDVDPWEHIPTLLSQSNPSNTYRVLEDASDNHIVFTRACEASWKNIDYPDAPDMQNKLVALAKAAASLYGNEPPEMGRLADWFKLTFGLNVALSDSTIEKNRRLRYFNYEDLTHDQTPHIKVRDGVKPNEVGRIHFALDKPGDRIIVNHVGLKLYGL